MSLRNFTLTELAVVRGMVETACEKMLGHAGTNVALPKSTSWTTKSSLSTSLRPAGINKMFEIKEQSTLDGRDEKSPAWDNNKAGKQFARGVALFAEGQRAQGVYVLIEGRVKISINSIDGKKLLLRIAYPGELLGLNSALTGKSYSATAETMDRCRIDFISRQDLLGFIDRDRITYLRVIESLTGKFTGLIEHTRLLFLSQTATERLARLLVKWCEESGLKTTKGTLIKPGLTHEEIGQIICASRETVTRILNGFKRTELIEFVNGDLIVRNEAKLREQHIR